MTGTDQTRRLETQSQDLAAALKHHLSGNLQAAERGYRGLIDGPKALPAAHCNLGLICLATGRSAEGIEHLNQAIALKPDYAQAHYNLGNAYRDLGQHTQAVSAYQKAVEYNANFAEAHCDLGAVQRTLGQVDQAIASYLQAIRANPSYAMAYFNLGNALQAKGDLAGALDAFSTAAQLRPDFAAAQLSYGHALNMAGRIEDALAAFRRAIAVQPTLIDAHFALAELLKELGRLTDAIASYRRVLEFKPDFSQATSRLIYCLSFTQSIAPGELLALTRDFVRRKTPEVAQKRAFAHRVGRTRVHVGFVSAEIGNHAVSYFLETYLRFYDRERVHVSLYSSVSRPEARKAALFGLADASCDIAGMSDDMARARILGDGLDVLIDTTSHMRGSRLDMLAQRCAPVQGHYIGFHGSTGLEAIDYFIGDDEITPPEFASHFSETLWRLPRLWVAYSLPAGAPEPRHRDSHDTVVFGSFNNLGKISDACLDMWATVMAHVPNSFLILKDRLCADPVMRARIGSVLQGRGIDPRRVEFIEWVPNWAAHMELYNRIDIALDTYPLNSGTTGFDALTMGTPLVALRGSWMGGRMTSAMLKALGRPEWVAETPQDYARIVTDLAADKAALRVHKLDLRQEVLSSPLCDGAGLATALDDAFIAMARQSTR